MDEDQVDISEADRRAETAKASLRSRLHELERRYEAAKDKLDLGARIAQHPRAAVGIAFGAGLLVGLLGRRGPSAPVVEGKRSIGGTIMAALGALAINALKDAALREGTELAKGWWADRAERDASRDPSVEAFLEH
ncbi:MAG: hypothetical protein AB7T06_30500 [Kofleriaceae bacterium]